MAVGVLEESHPEIVIVHLGNEVRARGEGKPALLELGHGQRNVGAAEIEAARRSDLALRLVEQQADTGTVEEREVAEAEQLAQSENLSIERFRTVDVGHRQGDLTDV